MISADTNLFLYAANPDSPNQAASTRFFVDITSSSAEFMVCELVLVEIYMQLRNPAVLRKPLTSRDAASFCTSLRSNPSWQHIDYDPGISKSLWDWASTTGASFRRIIDARLALTLLHHGVTEFATANVQHFQEFGFQRVWNPLLADA